MLAYPNITVPIFWLALNLTWAKIDVQPSLKNKQRIYIKINSNSSVLLYNVSMEVWEALVGWCYAMATCTHL